ncbi:MAG: DUF3422 domain-containing protein [Gammaproteobacteria bacterium]|nr:DUF3422 domain-containing protein [Gammaproteobacteria bacterium]
MNRETISPIQNKLLGITEYQQRFKLHNELHVGACEQIEAPTQISHLVLLCGNHQADNERQLITQLCERYGVAPPTPQDNHFSAMLGTFRMIWERHTEYSTYTFFHSAPFETPFTEPAIGHVPKEWLERLSGEVIAATHIAIESKERPQRSLKELSVLFASNTVIGSEVAAGSAIVWTDNQIHVDGFGRILIHDINLRSRQAGRLVQRLLEIESYRMLAMIPVPMMRNYIPQLAQFDERLATLTENNIKLECAGDEQQQLNELTQLAAEIERISAKTSLRFNASSMYYEIVKLRVSELRESRIQGLQMFQEFMEQRLSSAMDTCSLVNNKLETLSTRVQRVSSLLRTRVEISMEKQSRDLLRSMDRRAHLQLRLQEAVEGLSIVVLSYYLLGLISYGLKAVKASGIKFDTELVTGMAIPIVVAIVYLSVRRLRHSVHNE